MIPISDRNPSPIKPWVVWGLIACNVLIFIGEYGLNNSELHELMLNYGMVPQRVTEALQGKANIVTALLIPTFTSLFLHGGLLHLASNMWFLHIFGDNVEAKLGRLQFGLFYLFCGIFAHATQYMMAPTSPIPTIGASGAIAGVLGAYIVTWPRARIVTLVPIFFLLTFMQLPAVVVLGFWFILQLFQGVGTIGTQFSSGGVAYGAHVGGFIAGAILIKILPTMTVQRQRYQPRGRHTRRW
ncbi:MAG: rhomboid family intramembrane serine protease [Planctomycetota bacterium]